MKLIRSIALAGLIISTPITASAEYIPTFKEAPFEYYKVSKGDTFWFIAKRYGLDYKELMRLNPSVNPHNMGIGLEIRIGMPGNIKEPIGKFELQLANLVNEERSRAGLKPLKFRNDLSRISEAKSYDMIRHGYFSHQSPTYGSLFDTLKKFGVSYQSAGQNISRGSRIPKEVFDAWMRIPGYRQNILNPRYDSMGVGKTNKVWTVIFTEGQ